MDDLPTRLRRHAEDWHGDVNDVLREAAVEIERLRSELKHLIWAVEGGGTWGSVYALQRALPAARAALGE